VENQEAKVLQDKADNIEKNDMWGHFLNRSTQKIRLVKISRD
jgi:hypothetical protein